MSVDIFDKLVQLVMSVMYCGDEKERRVIVLDHKNEGHSRENIISISLITHLQTHHYLELGRALVLCSII